ncbi:hypothetical protein CJU89_4485 [Yarrowia sp. B02]|nr:hypothetical protein CJU89_4485 [Yarrowia sp. B02]
MVQVLGFLGLLGLAHAYNTFQNAATVDPNFVATTEDGEILLIDTFSFATWSMDQRQYVGQWNPFDKLRQRANDTGIDMLSHFRDETGAFIGSYDDKTGEITNGGKVVGHANDTGLFDESGTRRGLAKDNSTRQFYAPDQSFIGGVFVEPKVGPGSNGFTWDNLNKDYSDIAAAIGPKAGIVRDLSGYLTPRTRFYIRDRRYGDGAELVYIRNDTMDTLQIESDYTAQLNLSQISYNYTMDVSSGKFNFGGDGEANIDYSNGSVFANGALWGEFLRQTALANETQASKQDLDLKPVANLSFVDANQSSIGGVYNLDVILDSNNNLLYAINPNTWTVNNAQGRPVGTFNLSDYSLLSNNNTVLGQIVLKNDQLDNDTVLDNPAPASSTAANGAGSTLPTAAAALVLPFFLLMV